MSIAYHHLSGILSPPIGVKNVEFTGFFAPRNQEGNQEGNQESNQAINQGGSARPE